MKIVSSFPSTTLKSNTFLITLIKLSWATGSLKFNSCLSNNPNVLISLNKSELEMEEEVPPIGPGLPGYVEPKKESKYKFDENGTVISA